MSFFNRITGMGRAAGTADGTPSAQANVTVKNQTFSGTGGGQKGGGVPLELIRFNTETEKFELGAEALDVLRKVRGPVGVVSVSGRARQGKSFILNQLLGQSTGFMVGPTHRPCTKGLWMWSSPIARKGPDGSTYHLVLLDTEGIDAYDQTGQYSTQIFSLAVLLSSLFVYNQMGGIDEAALDRLSLVTEMTKHIRVRASAGDATESELSTFTPSFLWLLRDFYLMFEEDGRKVTPREYLETALQPLRGQGRAVDAKNQIRESIKALFPDRDCFALVRPMHEEQQLQKLDQVPTAQLRPEFREGLGRLTEIIFARAQPKRLGNQIVTGGMLAALADAYVQAINNGAVPTIATAWQGVAEAECRRAADAAEEAYHRAFSSTVAAEEAALDEEHRRCLEVGQQAFAQVAVGEEEVKAANEARFRERVTREFQQFRQQRLAGAALECEKLIRDETARLMEMARTADATPEGIQAELDRFQKAYAASAAAAGPTKWSRHAEFVGGTAMGILRDVAKAQAARREAEAREREAAAALQAQQAAQQAQQATARATELGREADSLRKTLADVKVERDAALERVQALKRELQDIQQRKESELQAVRSEASARQQHQDAQLQAEAARLTRSLQEAQHSAAERERDLKTRTDELESLRRQLASAGADSEQWVAKYRQAEAERREAVAARDAERDLAQQRAVQLQEEKRGRAAAEAKLDGQQAEWQARLADARAEAEARLAEARAEAEAARSAAAARGPEPAMAMETDAGGPSDADDINPERMTIVQLRGWLTEQGLHEQVWELNRKKAKKGDFVTLAMEVLSRG